MFNPIFRYFKYYFPEGVLRKYGLRVFPFIVSTFIFYLLQDILTKISKDYVKTMRVKFRLPILWFTPNAEMLLGFDFSVLTFIHEIYICQTYERLSEYRPGQKWVIVDAGANVGLYSLFVSAYQPRLVVALEPNPRNFKRLVFNLRINKARGVQALPWALAATDGYYRLFLSEDSFSSHIANDKAQQWTVITKAIGLRTIMHMFDLANIDLLKLDIEGAEHEILSSYSEVLQSGFVKRIVGEIHGDRQSIDKLINKLEALGFEVQFLKRDSLTAIFHARYRRVVLWENVAKAEYYNLKILNNKSH